MPNYQLVISRQHDNGDYDEDTVVDCATREALLERIDKETRVTNNAPSVSTLTFKVLADWHGIGGLRDAAGNELVKGTQVVDIHDRPCTVVEVRLVESEVKIRDNYTGDIRWVSRTDVVKRHW